MLDFFGDTPNLCQSSGGAGERRGRKCNGLGRLSELWRAISLKGWWWNLVSSGRGHRG